MPESNTPINELPDRDADLPQSPYRIDVANLHSMPVSTPLMESIVRQILKDYHWQSADISLAIVDDATIRDLNQRFLEHDYETDVLAFPGETCLVQRWLSGEIVVSGDTASNRAAEWAIEPLDELMLYIVHGMLHLVGLEDKTDEQRSAMRIAEQHYISLFGLNYQAGDLLPDRSDTP